MKAILKIIIGVAIIALFASPAFAASSETYTISAEVPSLGGQMQVTVSEIYPVASGDDLWHDPVDPNSPPSRTNVEFGTLIHDPVYNIFTAKSYYAVDIGVLNNSGAWSLQHSRTTPITNGSVNLDNNINVTFMNQLTDTTANQLNFVAYADSDYSIASSAIPSGWVRIYYGIGTGNTDPNNGPVDAPNVLPIGLSQPAGNYSGTVTLSLTP